MVSGYTETSTRASSNVSNTVCDVPSTGYFPDCTGGGLYYNQNFGGGFRDNFITEFSTTGAMVWSTYYGGAGFENDARIILGENGNEFFLFGNSNYNSYSLSTGGPGSYIQNQPVVGVRAYLAKFVNRQPVWFTFIGDGTNTYGIDGICDINGVVYVTGRAITNNYSSLSCVPVPYANTTTDFPTCFPSGIFNQPTYGGGTNGDAFIMAFSRNNQLLWSTLYGGSSGEYGNSLAYDQPLNKLVFVGNTESSGSTFPLIDPAIGNYQQNVNNGSTTNRDCFIAKFCLTGITIAGIKDINSKEDLSVKIYPNPNDGDFYLSIPNFTSNTVSYELMDILGKVVSSGNTNVNDSSMKFSFKNYNFKTGMYFLKLNSNNKLSTVKIIIE